ncbi:potassium channel family protein [Sulfitobacter sp. D35]|uniref:potassium channel family protein n=1 Tax=Sulfitobacter sp. D35 TaxID=3083252 RepID=UPI00296F5810|nr:potassium channel family protein [Sulfitobacter sp. D35]MDW4496423.1 potassium channel family protein [Sulfitobacter sp. D35]
MISSLLVGSAMIFLQMGLAVLFFGIASHFMERLDHKPRLAQHPHRPVVEVAIALFWIIAVLTVSIWSWAALYRLLGLFDGLEPALYFAIVSFTTVGYGDLVLDAEWRLLSGMTATSGLLVFGLFTAFLVETLNSRRS